MPRWWRCCGGGRSGCCSSPSGCRPGTASTWRRRARAFHRRARRAAVGAAPAAAARPGVVFYLHGNAGNLDSWFVNADFWRQANVDLFMLDYRGYGKSSGRITSQAQLEADVRAAWAAVAPLLCRQARRAVRPLARHRAGRRTGGRAAARPDGAGVALRQPACAGGRALPLGADRAAALSAGHRRGPAARAHAAAADPRRARR
jgi:hypothetical protein